MVLDAFALCVIGGAAFQPLTEYANQPKSVPAGPSKVKYRRLASGGVYGSKNNLQSK